MNNYVQVPTMANVRFFPTILKESTNELMKKMKYSLEADQFLQVNIGYDEMEIPLKMYNEKNGNIFLEELTPLEKAQYVSLYSRHYKWKIRLLAFKEMNHINKLYDWMIPYILLGSSDISTEVQKVCEQLIKRFDSFDVQRIITLNPQFMEMIAKIQNRNLQSHAQIVRKQLAFQH